jgi:hypothetical protein
VAIDFSDLIRAYEPVLYFALGERFFPSDCKRYLERCALWRAASPFDQSASWKSAAPGSVPAPLLVQPKVSARPDEPGTFLGVAQGGGFPFLFAAGPDEGFLELAGWTDSRGVSPSSTNRYANLDQIATFYNSENSTEVDSVLKSSRFWYHAEVFETSRLRHLMEGAGAPPHFKGMFPILMSTIGQPVLLCYYLFFPGHDEGLDDCEDADKFGSYAGEWACVAMLLKTRTVEIPIGGVGPTKDEYEPVAIGLTSRNVGNIGFLGGEQRIGMQIYDWGALKTVERDRGAGHVPGIHPRIFVAKGTHGLYPQVGDKAMPLFAPDDDAGKHCGATELLGKSLEDLDEEAKDAADETWVDDPEIVAIKLSFGGVGLIWNAIEWAAGGGGGINGAGTRNPDQFDHPPLKDDPGFFSVIVHPAGIAPPKEGAATLKFAWPSPLEDEPRLQTKAFGRTYSLMVDRVSPDPLVRQVWWPGIQGHVGFKGRWGARVTRDPKARRAGMKFPEFWEMFMNAFAKAKSA